MSTIAGHVASCLESFESIMVDAIPDASNQSTVSRILDELARFKVWSGNIGAHRSRKSSLDYRLRDASHLQKQIKSLLIDLNDTLKNALAILCGERIPWDELPPEAEDSDQDPGGPVDRYVEFETELDQISADVAEVVDCLLRLSVSIRNPAPHDRLKASARIDASPYNAHDISHVAETFRLADPKLVERLGKANSRRRQFFMYRASHHAILSESLNADSNNSVLGKLSTVASSIPQHLKDNQLGVKSDPIDEDELSESGITQTSYATTLGGSGRPRAPALPAEASKGPFECPFCYTMISVSSRRAWKKHIFADLRPYNCLALDCPVIGIDFARRHKWMDHMLQEHWRLWHCAFCSHPPFDSSECLQGHLQDSHLNAASGDQLRASVELHTSSRPLDNIGNCPLCQELVPSAKEYRRHVGRHLEDIALFVLPRTLDDDSGEESSEEQPLGSDDGSFATASSASHKPKERDVASLIGVQQGDFVIEELSDGLSLNSDDDYPDVIRPYDFEDAISVRSQSRSPPPPPPDLDLAIVAGLKNLNTVDDSDVDTDDEEFKQLLQKRREERHFRRMKEGNARKRTASERDNGSDGEDMPDLSQENQGMPISTGYPNPTIGHPIQDSEELPTLSQIGVIDPMISQPIAPPSINIDFAPNSREINFEPPKPPIDARFSTSPDIGRLRSLGKRCSTCQEKDQEVWVLPERDCPYCGTYVA
ncbi:hypothetical protein F5Y13DRAFT_199073 [Hypoxylon sp. FL1857]|nr:hypothetical protein F5Y13DRAFT_199073 [Hypoxylon sp. FL1857]